MLPPHFAHSTGFTSKTLLMHAAHARAEARAALRAARETSPSNVTEYPVPSSAAPTFRRAAWLTARLRGERGPSAP